MSALHVSRTRCAMLAVAVLACAGSASAASDPPYPFEGTWVRSDRMCTPQAPLARTYTAHDLVTPGGRCTLRRVAFGSGEFELFEDCRRSERPGDAVERIRMLGPDAFVLKHQVNRLKIPRGRRYARCTLAAQKPSAPTGRSFGQPAEPPPKQ